MGRRTKDGFSLSELLITLGIVGILCSTTLAVGVVDSNNCKIAETRAKQTNEALNGWSASYMKNMESGVGIAYSFENEDALIKSLKNYMNVESVKTSKPDEELLNIEGFKYKNYKKLTLRNGTILNVKYVHNPSKVITLDGSVLSSNRFSSYYAYITVNVPHKNKLKITNVYRLKYNELKDIGYIDSICEI